MNSACYDKSKCLVEYKSMRKEILSKKILIRSYISFLNNLVLSKNKYQLKLINRNIDY